MYVECDQHTSQARFLVATLDPAITHMTYGADQPLQSGQIVFTEDANLSGFVEKLKTLTVGESSS
jgi:protein transport protein SEC23